MLFDPFEKQFDLPALMIDRRDNRRGDLKIVREENKSLVDISGVKTDAAKQCWKFPLRVFSAEDDSLITPDAGGTINRMRLAATKLEVVFGAKNKVSQGLVETIQARKIDVATIHDDENIPAREQCDPTLGNRRNGRR